MHCIIMEICHPQSLKFKFQQLVKI